VERRKRKTCRFCEEKVKRIDYRDDRFLRRFVTERGKIVPGRMTGTCAKHQRLLTNSIKRARLMALVPFTVEEFY
jgi:small subunit ribosomal protein S18